MHFKYFIFPQMRCQFWISLILLLFCCGESFAADAVDQLVSGRCVGGFCGW